MHHGAGVKESSVRRFFSAAKSGRWLNADEVGAALRKGGDHGKEQDFAERSR
jgi:hypothetical protein